MCIDAHAKVIGNKTTMLGHAKLCWPSIILHSVQLADDCPSDSDGDRETFYRQVAWSFVENIGWWSKWGQSGSVSGQENRVLGRSFLELADGDLQDKSTDCTDAWGERMQPPILCCYYVGYIANSSSSNSMCVYIIIKPTQTGWQNSAFPIGFLLHNEGNYGWGSGQKNQNQHCKSSWSIYVATHNASKIAYKESIAIVWFTIKIIIIILVAS